MSDARDFGELCRKAVGQSAKHSQLVAQIFRLRQHPGYSQEFITTTVIPDWKRRNSKT